jgi:hypothetical protein
MELTSFEQNFVNIIFLLIVSDDDKKLEEKEISQQIDLVFKHYDSFREKIEKEKIMSYFRSNHPDLFMV